jgi:hypothetical protein
MWCPYGYIESIRPYFLPTGQFIAIRVLLVTDVPASIPLHLRYREGFRTRKVCVTILVWCHFDGPHDGDGRPGHRGARNQYQRGWQQPRSSDSSNEDPPPLSRNVNWNRTQKWSPWLLLSRGPADSSSSCHTPSPPTSPKTHLRRASQKLIQKWIPKPFLTTTNLVIRCTK